MNKAITDGLVLMPPPFADGLTVWARGDGTPGSDTYAGTATAAYVPADLDFGGCLEVQKTQTTQPVRYMGETPLLPGCYLRITARLKAMSGALPEVRIAGWAGGSGGAHVTGLPEVASSVALTNYGEVVEVSAIVGSGQRTGVDLVWGTAPLYGHFGLDLIGDTGGVVRIDDIVIEDITSAFHRDMMNLVDVRDFGAVGDGTTDNTAAFVAANAAANGRKIFVPSGVFAVGSSLTLTERVEFEGTLDMPDAAILSLVSDYDLPSYIDAFGDEELAFKKAWQALLNNADHESLDLGGRRITVTEPLDLQAAEGLRTAFSQRRVIRNGQFYVEDGPAWDSETATSTATYALANADRLTDVVNAANIQPGSLVTGPGVGREIYVREVNVAASEIRLSAPLYGPATSQEYTFTRFKYVLDFSGYEQLSAFVLEDVEILARGYASGILLPQTGTANTIRNCTVNRPSPRGVTSMGTGCQGLIVEGCQFLTNESSTAANLRETIGLNTNANDVKLRGNRATQFRHFAVLGGHNYVLHGNHIYQGDGVADGARLAGVIIKRSVANHALSANDFDNCAIEWTNEGEAEPVYTGASTFSGLTITGNIFVCTEAASWFSFIVVKPYGGGHSLHGVSITGNLFRSDGRVIDRVERIDTSIAPFDVGSAHKLHMSGNTFLDVAAPAESPRVQEVTVATQAQTWTADFSDALPFAGPVKHAVAVVPKTQIDGVSGPVMTQPWVEAEQGANGTTALLHWSEAVRGTVSLTVQSDS